MNNRKLRFLGLVIGIYAIGCLRLYAPAEIDPSEQEPPQPSRPPTPEETAVREAKADAQRKEEKEEQTFQSLDSSCESPVEVAEVEIELSPSPNGSGKLAPRALVILPSDPKAFKNIFERERQESDLKPLEKCREAFRSNGVTFFGDSSEGEQELTKQIQMLSPDDGWPLIVIGHSVILPDGDQQLVLPDGTMLSIAKLHFIAAATGRPCAVLTCRSRDFEIDKEITYEDALTMWTRAIGAVYLSRTLQEKGLAPEPRENQNNFESTEDFLQFLANERAQIRNRRMLLTVSAPPGHSYGPISPTDDETVLVWNIPLKRPNRTVSLLLLVLAGVGLIHYTLWQRQEYLEVSPVRNWQQFWTSIARSHRQMERWKHAGINLIVCSLVLAGAVGIFWQEVNMDYLEGRGNRWWITVNSLLAAICILLSFATYYFSPKASVAGSSCHVLAGGIAGGSWALLTHLRLSICGYFFYLLRFLHLTNEPENKPESEALKEPASGPEDNWVTQLLTLVVVIIITRGAFIVAMLMVGACALSILAFFIAVEFVYAGCSRVISGINIGAIESLNSRLVYGPVLAKCRDITMVFSPVS